MSDKEVGEENLSDYWFRPIEFKAQKTAKNQHRGLIGLSRRAFA